MSSSPIDPGFVTSSTQASAATSSGAPASTDTNMLLAVFIALLGSINVTQDLAKTSSAIVQNNANLQESKNKEVMSFRFEVLPDTTGMTQQQIEDVTNRVNQFNQNVQFNRQDVQSVVITLRQQGKSDMTDAQVTINYLQQNSSELTAVLKIMITVMQQITSITKPS